MFRSFRHNVSEHLCKKEVMESLIEELTGRTGKTKARRTYTKGYRVNTLYEKCIRKLEYKVDLFHLKNIEHWVGTGIAGAVNWHPESSSPPYEQWFIGKAVGLPAAFLLSIGH